MPDSASGYFRCNYSDGRMNADSNRVKRVTVLSVNAIAVATAYKGCRLVRGQEFAASGGADINEAKVKAHKTLAVCSE